MGVVVDLMLLSGYEPTGRRGRSLLVLEPFAPWGYHLLALLMCGIGLRIGVPIVRGARQGAIWTCEGKLFVAGVFRVHCVPYNEILTVKVRRAKTFGTRGDIRSVALVVKRRGRPNLLAIGELAEGSWDDVHASLHCWLQATILRTQDCAITVQGNLDAR